MSERLRATRWDWHADGTRKAEKGAWVKYEEYDDAIGDLEQMERDVERAVEEAEEG